MAHTSARTETAYSALPRGLARASVVVLHSWWGVTPVITRVFTTQPESARASAAETLADLIELRGVVVSAHPASDDAMDTARRWAAEADRRAVLIAGSVVLAGEAIAYAESEGWKA